MRIWAILGQGLRLTEYWRCNDAGFDHGNPHIERLHFLRQTLAHSLKSEFGGSEAAGCGNGTTAEPLRHRQMKGAETDVFDLTPPRHTSTLPTLAVPVSVESSHLAIVPCGTNSRRSTQPRSGRSARPKLLRVALNPRTGPRGGVNRHQPITIGWLEPSHAAGRGTSSSREGIRWWRAHMVSRCRELSRRG